MKLLILAFLFLISVVLAKEEGPEITIPQGSLKGTNRKTRSGRKFNAFTALPYAKPPIGELRFKPPEPAGPWEGVRDASRPHPLCPQRDVLAEDRTIVGIEDCLYLNVFTPQLPTSGSELLPVMVFIHGGGWFFGSANMYGPDLLMEKDVVLVTVNYRLGALGFLTSGDWRAVGNDGLKDQALAIRWVKDNIDKFGGDPNSITLFGQSAGGASAHYHMLSPLSKDRITGVIAQSGTALDHWALIPHFRSTRRSKTLAANLGCKGFDSGEWLECLQKADAYDIIKETDKFAEWDMDPMVPFKPVIEPNIPGAFLPEDPIEVIKSGKAANVPFMSGLTTHEGAFRTVNLFSQPKLVKELNENFTEIAPVLLNYVESAAPRHLKDAAPAIREFYFGDQPIDGSTKDKFTQMYGDAMFLVGADASVNLHAKFSKRDVYYYLFGYKGSASYSKVYSGELSHGVCHCDDLLYLFTQESLLLGYKPTEADEKVEQLMTTLWTNFAKYGNPTPEDDLVKWEPVKQGAQNYYHIKGASDVELKQGLYEERAKFWRDLPLNIRRTWIRDEL